MEVDRMNKISKQKFVVIQVLFAVFLISVIYTSVMPVTHAATVTSAQDKAISILSNVVGLDMDDYTAQLTCDSSEATNPIPTPPTTLSLVTTSNPTPTLSLPQDTVIFNLTAAKSNLRAKFSFINGKLNQISLGNYIGSPVLSQPTANPLATAQDFLQRYQSYTGNSLYGTLGAMLSTIPLNSNATQQAEDVRLKVSVFENQSENHFIWTYIDKDGNPAPMKDIVIKLVNGRLESFLDNWQLYRTSGVPTLSSKDAIATALKAAKNFTYVAENADGTNYTVSDFKIAGTFNVTLSYVNYFVQTPQLSTRGGDPYILYPSWYVSVAFDKVYPGDVTGLNVWVWADTGNIGSVAPMRFQAYPTDTSKIATSSHTAIQMETNVPVLLGLSLTAAIGINAIAAVYLHGNKNKLKKIELSFTISSSKRKIAALLLLVLPIGVIVAAPAVHASALKSELYASSYSTIIPWFDAQEYQYADEICEYIQMLYTQYNGVDSNDNAGPETEYNLMMGDIIWDHYDYPGSTVFLFAPGGPESFADSYGQDISAMDIWWATYSYTTIYFVMDGVCQSGHTQAFAQAWTQIPMSYPPDGFGSSDDSAHGLIGFDGQSPDISINSFQYYTQVAGYWIEWFYYFAIYEHDTVHQALNDASIQVFGVPYLSTPFISYTAWWPGGYMGENYYEAGYHWGGSMRVFGDSNIYISQGSSDYVSAPSISSNVPNPGEVLTSYQFSVSSTDSYGRNVAYKIFWGDGTQTTSGFYPSGETVYFDHSFSSGGQHTVTVYAESQYASWSAPSYYIVNLEPIYQTQVNVYMSFYGYYVEYYDTYYIYEPAGLNYLDFGSHFLEAYDYYDSTVHTTNPDWYDLGTGTTIDVLYYY
jgi:hypothetical protein